MEREGHRGGLRIHMRRWSFGIQQIGSSLHRSHSLSSITRQRQTKFVVLMCHGGYHPSENQTLGVDGVDVFNGCVYK